MIKSDITEKQQKAPNTPNEHKNTEQTSIIKKILNTFMTVSDNTEFINQIDNKHKKTKKEINRLFDRFLQKYENY